MKILSELIKKRIEKERKLAGKMLAASKLFASVVTTADQVLDTVYPQHQFPSLREIVDRENFPINLDHEVNFTEDFEPEE